MRAGERESGDGDRKVIRGGILAREVRGERGLRQRQASEREDPRRDCHSGPPHDRYSKCKNLELKSMSEK